MTSYVKSVSHHQYQIYNKNCSKSPTLLLIVIIMPIIKLLLVQYLLLCHNIYKKREVLQLNYALAHYWIAKDAPIGVNLPILSSALEAIASASLKDLTNDRQQSTYMPAKRI